MNPVETSPHNFSFQLRGFGLIGILAIAVILLTGNIVVSRFWILPVGAILVLVWAKLSATPWRELGFVKSKTWLLTIFTAILFGVLLKFFLKSFVMPLLGADPVNHSYHFLAGNRALLPAAVWSMFAAGFGEETVFRGYMFERLRKLLGKGAGIKIFSVVLTTLLFAYGHYANQGWPGVEQSFFVGLTFGTIFAVTKKIWFIMIAHTAFDLAALAMIYWNVETDISHLIFK